MTRRGRVSVAAVVVLAISTGFSLVGRLISSRPGPPRDPTPAVSAAAPRVRNDVPTSVPREVLERLPASRRALDFRVLGSAGEDVGVASEAGVYGRLYETLPVRRVAGGWSSPLRVEYALDAELTRSVFRILKRGRVKQGHVIVLDPETGRVLTYASTDLERFPPNRSYPAASLVKVITAAAALDRAPAVAKLPCRFRGSPYRLTPTRIDPPKTGNTITLRRALATSNNQCFAQLAVHAVGERPMMDAISRFGWLDAPAPAHEAGSADPGDDRFDFGKLGCGLAGCRITPLHAAQLASVLARGELVAPRWIERVVDADGRELPLADTVAPRKVMSPALASELRDMLVGTTTSGTARRAFRKRSGARLLGPVEVAGKTGSLSGKSPDGRYEWFIGAAPADEPRIAVAVLLLQGDLWWRNASQIGAEVLRVVFCTNGPCREEGVARWIHVPEESAAGLATGS